MIRNIVAIVAVACCAAFAPDAIGATPLRAIAFDGGWNLPLWAAQAQGFFDAEGLAVELAYTPSSAFLANALLESRADIGFAVIDNVIAYDEGQVEPKLPQAPDFVAFMGADGGFVSLVARPGIDSVANLAGKTLSVDAMTTGFAFVLREILARNGVRESDVAFVRAGGTENRYRELVAGKHDATILRTPFELLAEARGWKRLAGADALGAYQGTVGIVRRSYAVQHAREMEGFLRAYRAGTDWVYAPANRAAAEALLIARTEGLAPALASRAYDLLVSPQGGLSRTLEPDLEGIRTVLALRRKYAKPAVGLDDPAKYVDLSYHRNAFTSPRATTGPHAQ